jgi:hypothetical protein
VTYKNKIKGVYLLATKFISITKMHGATHINIVISICAVLCHIIDHGISEFHEICKKDPHHQMWLQYDTSSFYTTNDKLLKWKVHQHWLACGLKALYSKLSLWRNSPMQARAATF